MRMTLMHLRGLRLCPTHRIAVIQLDDAQRHLTMTFSAEPREASRLARVIELGAQACNPALDFVRALLDSFEAGVARIVLDDVQGQGIAGLVYVGWGGAELPVPCYPPDAIALALRAGVPIYATAAALSHAEPASPRPDGLEAWLERVRPDDFRNSTGEAPA
jgi:uncharacterized protein